jgi:hypothetical protein
MGREARRKRIEQIAAEDGVTPETVEQGIAEVEGVLGMIAATFEVPDDAIPRLTQCPECGGGPIRFAPLNLVADLPRAFMDSLRWADVKAEYTAFIRDAYNYSSLTESQKLYVDIVSAPSAVMLECQQCGKGFDPR